MIGAAAVWLLALCLHAAALPVSPAAGGCGAGGRCLGRPGRAGALGGDSMAFCAGGSLNSKQPRCCCCCSRPAGGSAPLRGSEHAVATRWLPPWSLGAGGEPRIGLFVAWEVPLRTSFWPGQRVAVSCWGSGASWGRPLLAVLFLPTPELQEGLRAPGSSGGGGPVGLQPRKAPAPCSSSSRQMSSATRGEDGWPGAARRGSGRSSLSSSCGSSPGGL